MREITWSDFVLLDKKSSKCPLCFPNSPPHRKEPVGGENDALEINERKKKIEDIAEATASLPACLGQKDHDALLAMRDQARLVSTAIQLLTSPDSNCLSSSPSIYHKVCSNEAAEPCDLDKPPPHSQVRVLCLVCCSSAALSNEAFTFSNESFSAPFLLF